MNFPHLFEVQTPEGKQIRLTRAIWQKILDRHLEFQPVGYLREIQETICKPDYVIEGWSGELLSMRWCTIAPGGPKYLCVVYRETNGDGFVITSFFISRYERLLRRHIVWQKS